MKRRSSSTASPEKTIIKNLALLRDNKNTEIIESLSRFECENDFVELHRNSVLGLAYNNLGKWKEAVPFLTKAHLLSLSLEEQFIQVKTLFNLFNVYFNLRDLKQCNFLFHESKTYKAENTREEILLYRLKFAYGLLNNKQKISLEAITKLDKLRPKMSEYARVAYIYDKIDYYLDQEKLDTVRTCMDELKQSRKYYLTANFKVMSSLLDFLQSGKTIYLYENDFKDAPYTWLHISVLKSLQENDLTPALESWKKLQDLSPQAFGPPFNYNGGKNFFFLCLKKLKAEEFISNNTSLPDRLKSRDILEFLEKSNRPIRKEDLYQLIYGHPPSDKTDFSKLKSVIKRIRQKYNVDIKHSQNCYYLRKDNKAS